MRLAQTGRDGVVEFCHGHDQTDGQAQAGRAGLGRQTETGTARYLRFTQPSDLFVLVLRVFVFAHQDVVHVDKRLGRIEIGRNIRVDSNVGHAAGRHADHQTFGHDSAVVDSQNRDVLALFQRTVRIFEDQRTVVGIDVDARVRRPHIERQRAADTQIQTGRDQRAGRRVDGRRTGPGTEPLVVDGGDRRLGGVHRHARNVDRDVGSDVQLRDGDAAGKRQRKGAALTGLSRLRGGVVDQSRVVFTHLRQIVVDRIGLLLLGDDVVVGVFRLRLENFVVQLRADSRAAVHDFLFQIRQGIYQPVDLRRNTVDLTLDPFAQLSENARTVILVCTFTGQRNRPGRGDGVVLYVGFRRHANRIGTPNAGRQGNAAFRRLDHIVVVQHHVVIERTERKRAADARRHGALLVERDVQRTDDRLQIVGSSGRQNQVRSRHSNFIVDREQIGRIDQRNGKEALNVKRPLTDVA